MEFIDQIKELKEAIDKETNIPLLLVNTPKQAEDINNLTGNKAAAALLEKPIDLQEILVTRTPKRPLIFTDPDRIDHNLYEPEETQRAYYERLIKELPEESRPSRVYYNLYKWRAYYPFNDEYFSLVVNNGYKEELIEEIVKAYSTWTPKAGTVTQYIEKSLFSDIKEMQSQAWRKTGFTEWDEKQGAIYSGLYILGGGTSAGKTTFITQLAEQMAEAGNQVLFFSMEQSQLEIVTKGIARRYAELFPKGPRKTSLQIRTEDPTEEIKQAIAAYKKAVGDRLHIYEGNFDCTVSTIKNEIANFIGYTNEKPVIFIDYLQVLRPDMDPDTGRKPTDQRQIAEYNVTEIKRASRQYKIPVFLVSSLNRESYLDPITEKSFKETGGIEYTADVLMALQLKLMKDKNYQEEKDKVKQAEAVSKANKENPRKLELAILKNRYGSKNYEINFEYSADIDTFKDKYAANFKDIKPMYRPPEEMTIL